jgi:hypothetical protein
VGISRYHDPAFEVCDSIFGSHVFLFTTLLNVERDRISGDWLENAIIDALIGL